MLGALDIDLVIRIYFMFIFNFILYLSHVLLFARR